MGKRNVEILAPAGSFESMVAAVNAGADAVYIGGSRFGARAYANNLDEEMMIRAIDYVHLHGAKIYMTVNTLVKEKELPDLYEYLKPYYEAGLDAVIVQDLGVFRYVREHFPKMDIHVSTQMTVTGKYSASKLKEMGAVRVVPARELTLGEIREIYDETGLEIETFVHGALCYCYSGQCLFSSLIGGRSGNRGRCAQPCRLPFDVVRDGRYINKKNEKYVLSLKDLCTLDLIPDILEAGVCSLKIEGRMKSPRYTAGVVSMYRKYVDMYLKNGRNGYKVDPADKRMLLDLFDRGGQSDGFYRVHNGRDMVVLKEKPAFREGNQELFDRLDRLYVDAVKKEKIQGTAYFEVGKPARLTLTAELTGRVAENE
ncbi:MAG: U32 family peptidase, partial [Lachnospiraceae bacterium]|nr:U32 family peptidase [Lachnospiraceae bacterium]